MTDILKKIDNLLGEEDYTKGLTLRDAITEIKYKGKTFKLAEVTIHNVGWDTTDKFYVYLNKTGSGHEVLGQFDIIQDNNKTTWIITHPTMTSHLEDGMDGYPNSSITVKFAS